VKKMTILAATLMLAGGIHSASAIEGGVEVGEDYSNVRLGLGTDTPGLGLSGEWLRSEHDGKVGNIGLNYAIGSDNWAISPGVKVMRTTPKDSDEGYAASVGGDVRIFPVSALGVYARYYWSPESWSEHTDGFREAGAGVMFRPLPIIDVRVGYKYAAFQGKNGAKDNVIADGPFVGASVHF